MRGLLVDFGGVLTSNVFDVLRGVLPGGGTRPRPHQAAVPLRRRGARPARAPRDRDAPRGGVRGRVRRAARPRARRPDRPAVRRHRAGPADDRRGPRRPRGTGSSPACCRTPGAWRPTTRRSATSSTPTSSPPRRACASPTRASTRSPPSGWASPPTEIVFVDDLGFNLKPARAARHEPPSIHRRTRDGTDDPAARRSVLWGEASQLTSQRLGEVDRVSPNVLR